MHIVDHQDETASDKAARKTANATWWIAAFTVVLAVVSAITFFEVHEGGKDTHDLAVAAKAQADKMEAALAKTDALIQTATNQAIATNKLAKASQEQVIVMGNQLKIARDTFNVVNRPYMGNEVNVKFVRPAAGNIAGATFDRPTDMTTIMSISVEIKNYGSVPARKAIANWEVFVEGTKIPGDARLTDAPLTIYPGRSLYLTASIRGAGYVAIVKTGFARLAIRVTKQYDGPRDHYAECDELVYSKSSSQFIETGECAIKPPPTK